MFHRQCTLKRENLETVAWIEEWGAKVGNILKLKDSTPPNEEWEVVSVGATRVPDDVIKAQERSALSFKKHELELMEKCGRR